MKKVFYVATLLPVLFLSACGDGVPNVVDPHNIVVNGQKMTQDAFIEKYCPGKETNETCNKVKLAARMDSARPGKPTRF